jgi:hypothetical protein
VSTTTVRGDRYCAGKRCDILAPQLWARKRAGEVRCYCYEALVAAQRARELRERAALAEPLAVRGRLTLLAGGKDGGR